MGTNLNNFKRIVHAATSVTLLGNGHTAREDLDRAVGLAETLICADGGGNQALNWGIKPLAVVGDLDSFDANAFKDKGIETIFVDDQNTTDFEKCLQIIPSKILLCVGFLGRRVDHQLSAFNAIAKFRDKIAILIGEEDIIFRIPSSIDFNLKANVRVSLFPMSVVGAKSTGLKWQIDGLNFEPNGLIGSSNAAIGGQVSIEILHGDMLLILPKDALEHVLDVLSAV